MTADFVPLALFPEPADLSLARYVALDREVDKAEDDGIHARWRFGRELLTERVGKKLPDGRLDQVAEAIGKSRTEVKYRALFADRYDTLDSLVNAIDQYGSWYAIVNEALASTAHLSSGKDEWETPQDLFDKLDAEFGFTFDVCASPANAKVDRYFAKADDALDQEWSGVCWMNPPYSRITEFMEKAARSAATGATVVCLVPSRTDVGWFWDFARYGEIRFIRGRLSFTDDEGNTGPAPFPSCVVVFGRPRDVVWYD